MTDEWFIAYVIREEIPKQGLKKVFFYTKKGDKYYYGKGNNTYDKEFFEALEKEGK